MKNISKLLLSCALVSCLAASSLSAMTLNVMTRGGHRETVTVNPDGSALWSSGANIGKRVVDQRVKAQIQAQLAGALHGRLGAVEARVDIVEDVVEDNDIATQDALRDLRQDIEALEQAVRDLVAQQEASQRQIHGLGTAVTQFRAEIAATNARVGGLDEHQVYVDARLAELVQLHTEQQALQERVAELQKRPASPDNTAALKELQEAQDKLATRVAGIQPTVDTLRTQIIAMNIRIAQTEADVRSLTSRVSATEVFNIEMVADKQNPLGYKLEAVRRILDQLYIKLTTNSIEGLEANQPVKAKLWDELQGRVAMITQGQETIQTLGRQIADLRAAIAANPNHPAIMTTLQAISINQNGLEDHIDNIARLVSQEQLNVQNIRLDNHSTRINQHTKYLVIGGVVLGVAIVAGVAGFIYLGCQIGSLAATVAQHGATLASHTDTLASHTTTLAQHGQALEDLGSAIGGLDRRVVNVEAGVAEHTGQLAEHGLEIASHAETLASHTRTLGIHREALVSVHKYLMQTPTVLAGSSSWNPFNWNWGKLIGR